LLLSCWREMVARWICWTAHRRRPAWLLLVPFCCCAGGWPGLLVLEMCGRVQAARACCWSAGLFHGQGRAAVLLGQTTRQRGRWEAADLQVERAGGTVAELQGGWRGVHADLGVGLCAWKKEEAAAIGKKEMGLRGFG